MPERRPEQMALEQMLGWLKPNPQLGAATGRAMESFGQVGQLLSETAEAVIKKQTQMVSDGMSSMAASMQDLQRARTPQDLSPPRRRLFAAAWRPRPTACAT